MIKSIRSIYHDYDGSALIKSYEIIELFYDLLL